MESRSITRRRFGKLAGTGGLALAATLAGPLAPASASTYFCCDLAYVPPNMTYTQCINSSGNPYVWSCTYQGRYCRCCEALYASGGNYGSAARCQAS